MYLSLLTLLCCGLAIVSGAPASSQEPHLSSSQQRYALLIPLSDLLLTTGGFQLPQMQDQPQGPAKIRVRRQGSVTGGVHHDSNGGTRVHGEATRRVWTSDNGNHRVDAQGHVERTYNIPGQGTGPTIYGGGASYSNPRGGVDVDVTRTPYGTQAGATGRANVWTSRDGSGSLDAYGSASRSFGGPIGTGPTTYGVGATYTHRFGG